MENRNSILWVLLIVLGAAQCQTVRYCVPEQQYELCQQMEQDVPNVFECVSRPDRLACMKAIRDGEADTINVDAQNIFVGGYYYNLQVLAYEEINRAPFRYSSVALVKRTSDISSLADLRGKKSCHTGVGRTAGWQIPLSQLQKRGVMDTDCRGEFETVTQFFSASCAPLGILGDPVLHAELRSKYPSLCSLCGDPDKCDWNDVYSGYEGALKCLTEEKGDVAFSKIEAVETFLKKHPEIDSTYEYLCLDGTRLNLSAAAEDVAAGCSWGRRPSNAFVVAETIRQDKKDEIFSAIRQAFSRYSPNTSLVRIRFVYRRKSRMRIEENRNLFIDFTDLKYNVYNGTAELKSAIAAPVVILHGAFDCKENWKQIAETIAEKTARKVYVSDIRNHGSSHWSPVASYEALFGDVEKFVEQLKESIILIGHGLGGTLAIDLALKKPELIEKLISIDTSPLYFPFSSDDMTLIIRTMKIGLSNVPRYFTLEEAKKQLKEYFDSNDMTSSVQELIFPTLTKTEFGFNWKTNLTYIGGLFVNQTIQERYPLLGIYKKPHLLIHSQLSKYIKKEDYEDIKKVFPNSTFACIKDCNHWIHIENQNELNEAIVPFMLKN